MAAANGAPAAAAAAAGPRCHAFSAEAEGDAGALHFQLLELPRQLYLWVGAGAPRMGNLCVAVPTRMDPAPAVATLIDGDAGDEAAGMARRLTRRAGVPVALSLNLPPGAPPELRAFAERRALEELAALRLARGAAGLELT
jgi:hypothetical protein